MESMEKMTNPTKVAVGPQGRLVIPSEIRRELGIVPGDVLVAVVDDQRLVLEKRETVLQRVRRRFAHIPAEISLSEELIGERRAEARKERGK
jgi:AbrB family looped-hinge helix DNA binding protein